MINTINMQDIRYLNLFNKITNVNTRFCFKYNEVIGFSVPKELVSKAIGEGGRNIKRMSEILGKRIKVISAPRGLYDIRKFMESVVSPTTFKDLEFDAKEIVITAGPQSKAALIGRDKRRLHELQKISKDFFDRDLRIV